MSRARAFALCMLLGAAVANAADRESDCIPAQPKGDPVRGASLHRGCFGCHGIERYTAPVTHFSAGLIDSVLRASGLSDMPPVPPKSFRGRVKSLDELRAAVVRRNEHFNPRLTPREIEDVVAYLNTTYYRFPAQ